MRRGRPNFQKEEPEGHRINHLIRAARVRVIDGEGNQLGIMTVPEALDHSRNSSLDLVEVSPLARPPVCRIMDYGRFKYQQKKKTQEAKKNTKTVQVKEIKVRPKTDGHDLDTKLRQIRSFLEEGHKVKVTMRFRGREIIYAERAMEMLFSIGKEIAELGEIEQHPNLMGRNMSMLVVPKAKK